MNTYAYPDHSEFSSCEDHDSEEWWAQLPNNTVYKTFGCMGTDNSRNQDYADHEDSGLSCLQIKKSIEFKKPTNYSQSKLARSISDYETQWDSSDGESDDEGSEMTEEQLRVAAKNYSLIVDKWYVIVRRAKEARFKGISSAFALKEKLYQMIAIKRFNKDSDHIFREYSLISRESMRNRFQPFSIHTNQKASALAEQKRRNQKRNESCGSSFASFFNFLIRPTSNLN